MDRKNTSCIDDNAWFNCVEENGSKGKCTEMVWEALRIENNPEWH